MSLQRYRGLTVEAESSAEYWADIAISDFARELHGLMKRRGVSNAELARRLGVRRQFVTKLLGGANVTLVTMVKLAMALDAVVRLRLEGKEERASKEDADSGVVVKLAAARREPGRGLGLTPQGDDPTEELFQISIASMVSGGKK
ncbi:MAG: helix-turn-helix transcriptional regulator [Thermoanaerobaculia bacterium]